MVLEAMMGLFHGSPRGCGLAAGGSGRFRAPRRLEFRGTQLSSDGGLLVMRELDDALGLSELATTALRDTRRGKNTVIGLTAFSGSRCSGDWPGTRM